MTDIDLQRDDDYDAFLRKVLDERKNELQSQSDQLCVSDLVALHENSSSDASLHRIVGKSKHVLCDNHDMIADGDLDFLKKK